MNTQIMSPSGAFSGIGFAVPVDINYRIVPQLIKYGKVIHPPWGIRLIPEQIVASRGIQGLVIGRITPDGPADRAGLQGTQIDPGGQIDIGAIILTIVGKAVRTANDLLDILEQHKAGDHVIVEYVRDNRHTQTSIELDVLKNP